jgi:hypothetical protein
MPRIQSGTKHIEPYVLITRPNVVEYAVTTCQLSQSIRGSSGTYRKDIAQAPCLIYKLVASIRAPVK